VRFGARYICGLTSAASFMKNKYILISPVHNEGKLLPSLVNTVISQTILPEKWVIVDDASTDGTEEIVKRYESRYSFIMYYKNQRSGSGSYYSRRTEAFLAGFRKIRSMEYDFVAVLDADLSLEPTYYESILKEFDRNPKLGISSGVYINKTDGGFQKVIRDNISTPGGLQMFRRECYEDIGGYVPLPYGGDDSLTDITARMKGWQTRSFPQYVAIHHRPVGTRVGIHILRIKFRQGLAEYYLGTHPAFMLCKSLRRIFLERPYFWAGMSRLTGFCYASMRGGKREIPPEALRFVRKEQIERLFSWWGRRRQDVP
jgi:biofilm PGA synthesis N-glycosyltransferase PgaC